MEPSELFLAEIIRQIQESKIAEEKGSRIEVTKLDKVSNLIFVTSFIIF